MFFTLFYNSNGKNLILPVKNWKKKLILMIFAANVRY